MLAVIFTLYAVHIMHRHIWILDLRGREGWKGLNITVWYSVWFLHTSFLYGACMFKSQRGANSYQTYHCPCAANNGGVYTVENMSCWRYKWKRVCWNPSPMINSKRSNLNGNKLFLQNPLTGLSGRKQLSVHLKSVTNKPCRANSDPYRKVIIGNRFISQIVVILVS